MRIIRIILKAMYQIIFNLTVSISQIFPDAVWGNKLRGIVVMPFLKKCGSNLQISQKVHILNPNKIEIGDNVFLGFGSWIHAQGGITIENEVMLGPYVCIVSGNHTLMNKSYRFGEHSRAPVLIKKGSWIGAHSVILPGSIIEDGCLIAAGGIVTKNIKTQQLEIYGGIPIKEISRK